MNWRLRLLGWALRLLGGLRSGSSSIRPAVYSVKPGALLVLECDAQLPAAAMAEIQRQLAGRGLGAIVLDGGLRLAFVLEKADGANRLAPTPGAGEV